MIWATLVLS
jgi:hypothetical protein